MHSSETRILPAVQMNPEDDIIEDTTQHTHTARMDDGLSQEPQPPF